MPGQAREAGGAFGDSGRHIEGEVEVVRLLPQGDRGFGLAGIVFENRQAAQGVGKIERPGGRVGAVEREGLVVAGLGQAGTSGLVVNVAEVPDGVREVERFVQVTKDGDRLFVGRRAASPSGRRLSSSPRSLRACARSARGPSCRKRSTAWRRWR